MKVDFSDQVFRCSQLGLFMGELKPNLTANQAKELERLDNKDKLTDKQKITLGELIAKRDAKPALAKTAITKLREIHMEELYHRSEQISSKYLEKGIAVEEKSKDLDAIIRRKLITGHPPRQTNDYITGQADAIHDDTIIDYKSSWTRKTFPLYDEKVPTIGYYWQLQGYMWLYGINKSELVYCLVDTPFNLIDDELRRLNWKHGISIDDSYVGDEHIPLIVETVTNLLVTREGLTDYCQQSPMVESSWFVDFYPAPDPLRHRVFEIPRNEEAIESIKAHVKLARTELNRMSEMIADRIN